MPDPTREDLEVLADCLVLPGNPRPIVVWGAAECRKFCRFDSRKTFGYWRKPERGESRFPDPCCRINGGRTEVWDPADVGAWWDRTRKQRGFDANMERTLKWANAAE
jgi:hypothetical protein